MDHPETEGGLAPPACPVLDKSQAMSALLLELATMPRRAEAWERALRPGETVGRFQLVREIGRGGFGIVYEARDRKLGRSVAFKAVRPGRGVAAGAGELLLREAEAIARLSHPNLVTLHDVGRCEQGPYLVLELLRGLTLGERLARGPVALEEALGVAMEVARGLAHAHAQGVVHRDLKPSNVFLCEGGLVKVLDFGMAHAFGRERLLGGTPAYMAPEQWKDGQEDERTDVFALGVMIHQMLTGEVPLPEGGRSLEHEPAPQLAVPECPALGALVARMLAADPCDRPREVAEVLAALSGFRASLGAGEESTARFALRPRRRGWALGGAALLLVLLALAAFGPAGWRARVPAPGADPGGPRVAVLPFTTLSASPDDASLAAGIHAELITELTQIGGLRVIGRSSVQSYRSGPRDLRTIARELRVDAILEGTVQREGERVRIQAQLVDPATGQARWAEQFDRRVDDLFAIQSDVALEIARAMGARLSRSERALVERVPTHDYTAHELYLRALYFWGRSSEVADRRRAQDLLAAAVARDPAFALAHAWLAVVDTELANEGVEGFPYAALCAAARVHAGRALESAPELPQAHGALAEVRWACDHDSAGALREYEVQVRGMPGDAVARVNVGYTRMALGQWAPAVEDLRAAFALDPRSYFVSILVADRLVVVRRFDEASQACQRAQELSPGDVRAQGACALIPFWQDGDLGPARTALDGLLQQWAATGVGGAAGEAMEYLSVLPERTLELLAAGRLPDPISSRGPFIPRAALAGAAHAALGHRGEARAAFATAVGPLEAAVAAAREDRDPSALAVQLIWLARAHAGVGRGEEAMREAREALDCIDDVPARTLTFVDVAEIALAAGRREEALQLIAAVLDSPGGQLTPAAFRAHPVFAALRGDARFEAVLRSGGPLAKK